jgi:DNA-binding CsgD family transcriptional regulator
MEARIWAEADIIRRIYDGLLEREQWPNLLSAVTRAFGSTYSAIVTRSRQTGSVRILATDFLQRERQRAYEAHYARLSPLSFFRWKGVAVGEVLTDDSYADYRTYLRSEIYNDFFRPLNADHLMFIEFRRDHSEQKSLVLRRGRDAGRYSQESVRRLKALGHHLFNAERLAVKIGRAARGVTDFSAMLERLAIVAFITDRNGKIHYMTPAAQQFLVHSDALTALGGRLTARHTVAEGQLQAAIRNCVDSMDHPDRGSWRILHTSSPAGRNSSPTVFVSAMMWTDGESDTRPMSLVIVNDHRDERMVVTHEIARLYGLTPAEGKVAVALCKGCSLIEYAASANISVLTARTLLKRAQEKTDTHSQAELVSLLLRRSGILVGPQPLKTSIE